MILSELIKNVKTSSIYGDVNTDITGVDIDSRKVSSHHLFIAMKGTQVDGHRFIGKAIERGASAVLCEEMPHATPVWSA